MSRRRLTATMYYYALMGWQLSDLLRVFLSRYFNLDAPICGLHVELQGELLI